MMASGVAQRRAAKAIRRKAIVKAKRLAEPAARGLASGEQFREIGEFGLPQHKASEALLAVADPLLHDDDDRHALHNKLTFAMFAWNLSVLPSEKRNVEMPRVLKMLGDMATKILPIDQSENTQPENYIESMINHLIHRKTLLYPIDRRLLLNLDVSETDDGPHVQVASTLYR
jgi:hypothetical protein